MKVIPRYSREQLEQFAADLHRRAVEIDSACKLSFADARVPLPSADELVEGARHADE
jgi:hypothetical protein